MKRGWEEWEAFSGPKNKSEQKFINNLYKKDLVKNLPTLPTLPLRLTPFIFQPTT